MQSYKVTPSFTRACVRLRVWRAIERDRAVACAPGRLRAYAGAGKRAQAGVGEGVHRGGGSYQGISPRKLLPFLKLPQTAVRYIGVVLLSYYAVVLLAY